MTNALFKNKKTKSNYIVDMNSAKSKRREKKKATKKNHQLCLSWGLSLVRKENEKKKFRG
jgi:hypothetical protein